MRELQVSFFGTCVCAHEHTIVKVDTQVKGEKSFILSIHPSPPPLSFFCLKKRASVLRMARKRKSALLSLYFPHSFLLIFFGFCFCLLYLLAYLRRKNMTSRLYNSSQEDYMSVNGCNWSSHKYELKKYYVHLFNSRKQFTHTRVLTTHVSYSYTFSVQGLQNLTFCRVFSHDQSDNT